MTCDRCGKPAVVHDVRLAGGKKLEVHLCEEHAREAGYALPPASQVPKLVGQVLAAAASTIVKSRQSKALPSCATCRLTFHKFKQCGLLGCADCYQAFGDALAALIERTQNAAVHHVGKVPRRSGVDLDLGPHRQRLMRELEEAVKAEQYERAAKLRDRLRALEPAAPEDRAAGGAGRADGGPQQASADLERGEPEVGQS